MSRKILGLDFGSDALSGVLISCGLKSTLLEAAARVPIENSDNTEKALTDALASLSEKMDFTGAACTVSLPAGTVSFRNLNVPFREKKKIEQVLPFELELTLPQAVENLIIDFQKTGANGQGGTNLFTAAVEKHSIERLLAILSTHKIDPEIVTIRAYPLALCLTDAAALPDRWVLGDLDGNHLSLYLVDGGRIVMARSTPVSQPETGPPGPGLITQIRRTLLSYEDTSGRTYKPERLLLSGRYLADPELERELSDGLAIPTGRANPAQNEHIKAMRIPENIKVPAGIGDALALTYLDVVGGKGLNFRKGPFEPKNQWVRHRKNILSAGLIGLLLLVLSFGNVLMDTWLLQNEVNRLNREIRAIFTTTLPGVKRIVNPLQQLQLKLKDAQENLLQPLAGSGTRAIDILNALSTGIPRQVDVVFTRVVISRPNVLISGHTNTFNAVDDIQSRLAQTPVFHKVTISSANLEKSGNRINFKLKVQL
ncbi:MAG: pilus assembly protein PilM [Desulfobacterales bacterium]|nr:pilus assembly protein PilM [Desulfobacterales bacterium]